MSIGDVLEKHWGDITHLVNVALIIWTFKIIMTYTGRNK